ncbi:MAG: hypothetical protein ACKVVT_19620 [Dehalococcoidia bacterium]
MPTIVFRGDACHRYSEFWNSHLEMRFAMIKYLRWFLSGAASEKPDWEPAGASPPDKLIECYQRIDIGRKFSGDLSHMDLDWFPHDKITTFFRVLNWFYDENDNYQLDPGEIAGFGYPSKSFGRRFEKINGWGFLQALEASLYLKGTGTTVAEKDTTIDGVILRLPCSNWKVATFSETIGQVPRHRKIDMYWVCGKDYSADMQVFWDEERVTVFTVTPPMAEAAANPPKSARLLDDKAKAGRGMILVRNMGAPWDGGPVEAFVVDREHGG